MLPTPILTRMENFIDHRQTRSRLAANPLAMLTRIVVC